jgi:hypothetical protein
MISNGKEMVFETNRLLIRTATIQDVSMYRNLWVNPDIMKHARFPHGLPFSKMQ